jgi:hypothetical protein
VRPPDARQRGGARRGHSNRKTSSTLLALHASRVWQTALTSALPRLQTLAAARPSQALT